MAASPYRPLPRSFYRAPAVELAPWVLGKRLVHRTPSGLLSARITEVEAYVAEGDEAAHGHRRTPRSARLFQDGGVAYVYLVYGLHHMFSAVVDRPEAPEAVFVRAATPVGGIDLVRDNAGRGTTDARELTDSPGKLTRAIGITTDHDGVDLTATSLFLADVGERIPEASVRRGPRVGLNSKLEGSDRPLRFWIEEE